MKQVFALALGFVATLLGASQALAVPTWDPTVMGSCPPPVAAASVAPPVMAAASVAPIPVAIAPSATQTQVTALVPTTGGANNSNILASLGSTTESLAARYALQGEDEQKSGRTAAARVLAKSGSSSATNQTVEVAANAGVKSRLDNLLETLKKKNAGKNRAFDQAIAQLQSGSVPEMVRGLRTVRGLLPKGDGATVAALADLQTLVANSTHYQ